jgi:hypothetical protein
MDQESFYVLPSPMVTDGNSLSPGSMEHADQGESSGFVTTNSNSQ